MNPQPSLRANFSPLLTDLYQLTMAYGYWRSGNADQRAVFHLSFRKNPFNGGFTIAAGLSDAVEFLRQFHFQDSELNFLSTLKGGDGRPLFEGEFLKYLEKLRFRCDIDAIQEGTVVFPHEPLLRIEGPILQAQLVETALLNLLNFQSLIATKAARVCLAAQGDPVIEFGLRRAQGIDGAMAATRAAYIGGCTATSNVLAGHRFGIPVKGTHAHSWVLAFSNELEAFMAYAEAMPNNCVLLVDTFNTLEGVRNAVKTGDRLRRNGHALAGVRLDSGDLAYLSIEARKILDAAGFTETAIVASNDLDEHLITSLKQQGAAINIWGVGTKLVTAFDQPALGGVYKLSALQQTDGTWAPRIKLSEQSAKVSNPGILQVRRFRSGNQFIGDALFDISRPLPDRLTIVDPADPTRRKQFNAGDGHEDLLQPVIRDGAVVSEPRSLENIRAHVQQQLAQLHPSIKRFDNPHLYPAGLELSLHEFKTRLILEAKDHYTSA